MKNSHLIDRIIGTPGAPNAERVRHELNYARALNAVLGGKYDDLLDKVAEETVAKIDTDGCLTAAAAEACEEMMLPMQEDAKSYTVHFTGHAHIDMNWMWGYNETTAVALDTFRTTLKMMDRYPLFKFSQSQTSTYEIVEQFDPALFRRIAEKIREGRWEVSASTWVEADKNMIDYESMARHLLYTRKYMMEKFGLSEEDVQIDFEPDTFGHSRYVPEILAQGGVKYYYHMRGNMPEDGRDLHYWQSPSGKRVLMHREPEGYGAAIDFGFIARVPEDCRRNGIHQRLKPFGVGDHGGGPTRRDIERIIEMMKWPIAPTMKFSTYREYFAAVEEENVDFPVINDEINYVFTGCYSSQAAIKGANRRSERALFAAEAATAVAHVLADAEPYDYAHAWTNTLFNQFHDIVTGSGVVDTRNFAVGRYQETMAYAYGGRSRALNELAAKIDTSSIGDITDRTSYVDGAGCGYRGSIRWESAFGGEADILPVAAGGTKRVFTIFNPTAYDRLDTVRLTLWDYEGNDGVLCVKDADGNELPIELLENGNWWLHNYRNILTQVKVPAMGYTTVYVEHGTKPVPMPLSTRDRIENYPNWTLENKYIRAQFNDHMELVSFFNKETGKEMLAGPAAYFSLVYQNPYIDSGSGMAGNAWSECYPVSEQNLNETDPVFVTAKAVGSLRPMYGYRIVHNNSEIRVSVWLDEDAKQLSFDIGTEWRESFEDKKGIPALRFICPLPGEATRFISKIPGGFIDRKPEQHDVPAIGCAAAITKNGGVALMTDATYGFRIKDGALSTTLLRNSNAPDNCPELGFRQWKLALAPTDGSNEDLNEKDSFFANNLHMVANNVHEGPLPMTGSLFSLSEGVALVATKLAESGDGMIIRLTNIKEGANTVTVKFTKELAKVQVVEATEKVVSDLFSEATEFKAAFKVGETLAFKVQFKA